MNAAQAHASASPPAAPQAEVADLHVVFRSADTVFALPSEVVLEMVRFERVTRLPGLPSAVAGLLNRRGRVVGLLDLRELFGLRSVRADVAELQAALEQRRAEHMAWLDALEASVRDGVPFQLGTDPHACRFGRWYDGFTTDNPVLEGVIRRFDAPHKRIHAIAGKALQLPRAEGLALIDATRHGDLRLMIELFEQTITTLSTTTRTIVLITEAPGQQPMAVLVDGVLGLARLRHEDVEAQLDHFRVGTVPGPVSALALHDQHGVVQVLSIDALYAAFGS
jgi:chemotaxis signal transduction protein